MSWDQSLKSMLLHHSDISLFLFFFVHVSFLLQPVHLKPLHVLQCHSKQDSPEDFSTQLWACAFQPLPDSTGTTQDLERTPPKAFKWSNWKALHLLIESFLLCEQVQVEEAAWLLPVVETLCVWSTVKQGWWWRSTKFLERFASFILVSKSAEG